MRRIALTFSLVVSLLAVPARSAEQAPDPTEQAAKPIKALLVIGGCCHDYAKQGKIITEGISARVNVEWTIAYDPDKGTKHLNPVYENPDWAKGFDVIVHDECTADVKDLEIIDRVLKPHREGLPAVLLHCAMHSYRSEGFPDKDTPWFQFTGLVTTGHGRQEPIDLTFETDSPITKGLQNWTTGREELYNNVRPPLPGTKVIARGKQGKQETVVAWTNTYGDKQTKVFGTTLGHNNDTIGDARYLDLITRGMLWSLDKLDDQHLKPAQADAAKTQDAADAALAVAESQSQEDGCACEDKPAQGQ